MAKTELKLKKAKRARKFVKDKAVVNFLLEHMKPAKIISRPKKPSFKQPKATLSKPTNTLKASKGVKIGTNSTVSKTSSKPVHPTQNKINKTGIFTNPKLNSNNTAKSGRKTSAEKRSTQTKSGNRANNSVGKRPIKKNIHNFTLEEEKVEQTPEFKELKKI